MSAVKRVMAPPARAVAPAQRAPVQRSAQRPAQQAAQRSAQRPEQRPEQRPAQRPEQRPEQRPAAPSPAPAAPVRQEQRAARDLGGLLAWLRGGPRAELPFRRELEQRVRGDLSAVEAYRGERARRVADAVDARAFAVGHVVGFADERPSFADVAHEVAHVVQMLGPAPSPRAWPDLETHAGAHPIGTAPWDSPYELPARLAAPALADQARGPRAPIALYRAGKKDPEPADTDPADLPSRAERALVAMMRSRFALNTFAKKEDALFGVKDAAGTGYKQVFKESSPEPWKLDDFVTQAYPAGTESYIARDDLRLKIFGTELPLSGKYRVYGKSPRLVKVRYGDSGTTLQDYAFVGADFDGGFAQAEEVFAIKGRPNADQDAQHPSVTIGHYELIVARLKEIAKEKGTKLDAVEAIEAGSLKQALARAKNPDGKSDADLRTELNPIVDDVRHEIVKAVAASYSSMEDLHAQVFASDVFTQKPFLKKGKSPYHRFKAQIFELWLSDRSRKDFERVRAPKAGEDKVIQPVFAERPADKYLRSDYLLKVRHGDGVLRMKGTGLASYFGIAEAKAYTVGPAEKEIAQIQDYARILTIPILGYMEVEKDGGIEIEPVRFEHVTYFFSNIDVAGMWLATLDQHLGTKYTADPNPRGKQLTLAEQIAALEKAIESLEKENLRGKGKKATSTLKDVDPVKAQLAALKADAAKPEPERAKELPAIQDALVKAVIASYPSIADLYDRVLDKDKVFPVALSALTTRVVEGWLAAHGGGRKIDATLESPLAGSRKKLRPLFGAAPTVTSEWGAKVAAGTGDLEILDDRIIVDHLAAKEGPTDEDRKVMLDVKGLRGVTVFLVSVGGAGPRFFARPLAKVEYQFAPEATAVAELWRPELLKVFAKELGKDVFVSPDPTAAKAFTLRFALNPVFEAKVADATTLKPPVTVVTKHAGITIEKIEVTLTEVRKPELASGSVTFGIANDAMKGVVSADAPQQKPIVPAVAGGATAAAAPSKSKAKAEQPVHGRVENRLGGLKSKLDSLLKRVRTDAKLVDGGVAATLRITAGPSGVPKIDLDDAEVTATVTGSPKGAKLAVKGSVGISTAGGKIKGGLDIDWVNNALSIKGKVRVENLIDGLAPVDAVVTYKAATETEKETLQISIVEAAFKKRIGAVTIGGTARNLTYDVNEGTFSGTGELSADLGAFGKASAAVTIEKNVLSEAKIKYDQAGLRYPKQGTALITGGVTGEIVYKKGALSGSVTGDATLDIPALKKLSKDPIALSATVNVSEQGALSGGFKLKSAVTLGTHFRIDSLSAAIDEHGKVTSEFSIAVVKIPVLGEGAHASISCAIGEDGFKVVKADISLPFGKVNESRFWGTLKIVYEKGAFVVTLALSVKLKKGMVAEGTLTYNTETQEISGSLKLPRIQLLSMPEKRHTIFALGPKQISIVQVPGIVGLYIDVDFALQFAYAFDLAAIPTVKLKGFKLDTFQFLGASASVQIVGEGLTAKLIAIPRLGIGAFAFHPKILRGGGGISVPIEGVAQLKPTKDTVAYFSYEPATGDSDSKVSAGAKIGLRLTFKVDAAIEPWAEFVVLDGMYKAPWKGAPLASFPLLPERELFTFEVNFGDPVEEQKDPALPKKSKAPAPDGGRKTFEGAQRGGEAQVKKETPDTNAEVKSQKDKEPPGDEKGFDILSLVKGIVGDGKFKVVWDLIQGVADTIAAIFGFIGKIIKLVKRILGEAYQAMVDFLKGLKAAGYKLFNYVLTLLEQKMSPTVFGILEPILRLLAKQEDKIFDLIDKGLPDTVSGWIDFGLSVLGMLVSLAWDGPKAIAETIYRIVVLVKSSASDAATALLKFMRLWVSEGKVGVRQNRYYFGSETIEDLIGWDTTYDFWAPDEWKAWGAYHAPDKDWPVYEFSSAPALPLWVALGGIGAPKNSSGDYWF